MKQKILIERVNKDLPLPEISRKGDWIDLRCAETSRFKAPQSGTLKTRSIDGQEEKYRNVTFDLKYVPLGVKMRLPDGCEAIVTARSSLPMGFGVMMANNIGIIDGITSKDSIGYVGPNDEWKAPLIAIRDTTITKGERICQFRIQLSQKASVWQKIKWHLSNGIELVEVGKLPPRISRGGFGTSGKK